MVDRKKIIRVLILSGILLFLGFLLSQTVGLGAGGFDSETVLKQFNFYTVGIGFMLVILIFYFLMMFWRGDDRYGGSIFYANQGESPSIPFFKKFSSFQLFLLSLIIFSIFGSIAVYTNMETFTGFRVLEHQFTPIGELTFSSLLIPISENLGSAALIAVLVFLIVFIANRQDWSRATYNILIYLSIPLLVGIYGYTNHLLRYGGSDISTMVVFLFWAIGGLITVLTGSFIPFWIMHFANNFFFDIKTFLASETILTFVIISIVILTALYLYLYVFRKKKVEFR